jgi:hypothetical protein
MWGVVMSEKPTLAGRCARINRLLIAGGQDGKISLWDIYSQ